MSLKYIAIAGFSASGSSAVVDLLKEYRDVFECDAEIRIIQDPYGIRQLERNLVDDWNYLTSSAAVDDFLTMASRCARSGGGRFPFSRCGLSYSKTINKDFMKITEEYIRDLSEFSYYGDYYYLKFKKTYPRYVFDRCVMGIDRAIKKRWLSRRVGKKLYFASPSKERFQSATKRYFDKLFSNYDVSQKDCYIILDQAVSVNDTDAIYRYFNNGKLIIVDRDPRDMYIDDIVTWGGGFLQDMASKEMGYQYVLKHKTMHSRITPNSNTLYIRFEDLVLNYKKTVEKIESFVGLSSDTHIKMHEFLKPEISSKHVGIWREHYNHFSAAIDIIETELRDYCLQ